MRTALSMPGVSSILSQACTMLPGRVRPSIQLSASVVIRSRCFLQGRDPGVGLVAACRTEEEHVRRSQDVTGLGIVAMIVDFNMRKGVAKR